MSVLLLLFFLHLCLCQECLSPCNVSFSTCAIVDYPIYPIDLNISANELQAADIINQVRAYGSFISQDCQEAVSEYTCGILYPACTIGEGDTQLVVEKKPCKSMCNKVNTVCAPYLTYLTADQLAFVNCEQTSPDGTPKFSTSSDCYSLNNTFGVQCNTRPIKLPQPGCQHYDPLLSPLSGAVCSPFISSEIFVPNILDPNIQSRMDSIANASGINLIQTVMTIMPIGCYKYVLSLLCQTTYPTCTRVYDVVMGEVVEGGATPCLSLCETVLQECAAFLSLGHAAIQLNCSATSPNGLPVWPPGPTFDMQYQNFTVEVPCARSLFPPNASSVFVLQDPDCPPFLTKTVGRTDADRMCWVSCPDPTYSEKQWDDLVVFCLAIASISMSLMLFLVLSYLLIAEYRQRQAHMCIFISAILMSLSVIIGGRKPQDNVWCVDKTTYSSSSNNAYCGVQGFLIQFSTLSVATWWLTMAFHMFLRIVRNSRTEIKTLAKFYHLFAWGLPLIFSVVTAAIKGHGFSPPIPICYIQTPGNAGLNALSQPTLPVDFIVFFIPICVLLFIAILLMSAVAIKVFKVLRESATIRDLTTFDLAVQRRLMFFVVFLLGVFLIFLAWRLYIQKSNAKEMLAEDFAFIVCKLDNAFGFPTKDTCSGDTFPRRFDYKFTFFGSFIVAGMGIFIFVGFGTDYAIYRFWSHLLRLEPKQMIRYVTAGSCSSSKGSQLSLQVSSNHINVHSDGPKSEEIELH